MLLLDADRLRNFPISDVVQTVTERDCALYALSVGFGQKPLDIREHRFVDPAGPLVVTPSMALVLGYPGFWLGNPSTGVDAARVAHVNQDVVLHAPLPTNGSVRGRTRVTGLFERGQDRGLALTSTREISEAETGVLIATISQTHFLRNNTCSEALPPYVSSRSGTPDGAPDRIFDHATRPEQALLYRLNGDMNPLHIDPLVASVAGFDSPILHGMCTFGIAVRALLATLTDFNANSVRQISMAFRAPVYPGETLRTEIWAEGRFRVRSNERNVVVVDGGKIDFIQGALLHGSRSATAPAPAGLAVQKV
ncbi:MAG: 3-alpha,7-alpha,12-alpha-trihydroxy-5-beta-cholest-24-enoyl-CoA hydratase [Mesorhizobium sp.]|nr:3-alpha,7-alpha,12-alpha-trihydroxy-5-beta-cholest-24-enoyl-CoA hydratase [Mesorhizobium sp.]